MSVGSNKLLAGLLTGGSVAVYALIAHYSSAQAEVGPWAVVLALAPVVAAVVAFFRRSAVGIALGLAAVTAGLAGLVWIWPLLQANVSWMYFLQHIGVNGALGVLFGRTLLAGRRPLCTAIASRIHRQVTPGIAHYTRQVTLAWTVFFAAMVAISCGLFALAPVEVWSVFANLLTFPLVGLMFVVENEVRKRVIPPEERVGMVEAIQAFRAGMKQRPASGGGRP